MQQLPIYSFLQATTVLERGMLLLHNISPQNNAFSSVQQLCMSLVCGCCISFFVIWDGIWGATTLYVEMYSATSNMQAVNSHATTVLQ